MGGGGRAKRSLRDRQTTAHRPPLFGDIPGFHFPVSFLLQEPATSGRAAARTSAFAGGMMISELWEKGTFVIVLTDGTPVRLSGKIYGAFAVYERRFADLTTGSPRRASYLIHIETGQGLGVFETIEAAQLAGEITDAVLDPDFFNLPEPARKHEADALFSAWAKFWLIPTMKADDARNMIWRVL